MHDDDLLDVPGIEDEVLGIFPDLPNREVGVLCSDGRARSLARRIAHVPQQERQDCLNPLHGGVAAEIIDAITQNDAVLEGVFILTADLGDEP